MRILHVIPTYLPAVRYGGPAVSVDGLCRALSQRGHDVHVFTTNVDGPNDLAVPVGVPIESNGVKVTYFRSVRLRRLYGSADLTRALAREIGNFAVVHIHSVFLYPTLAASRLARRMRVPYVISPRGMLVGNLIRRRSWLVKSAWIQLIEKGNLRRASAIHVTSELERQELQAFEWNLPSIFMVPNGIDLVEPEVEGGVAADVRALVSEEPLVLFLGRISWKKGLDLLINAFALTAHGRLAIVGPDDEQMTEQLAQLARGLNLTDRVQILPRAVTGVDKEYLFASARLFVLPSYSENFGNAVVEAMCRHLPVVVTTEVGAKDVVQRSGGGMVVPAEERALGAAISRLVENVDVASGMGEKAALYVKQHYGWPRVAAEMESLYEKVVTERGCM